MSTRKSGVRSGRAGGRCTSKEYGRIDSTKIPIGGLVLMRCVRVRRSSSMQRMRQRCYVLSHGKRLYPFLTPAFVTKRCFVLRLGLTSLSESENRPSALDEHTRFQTSSSLSLPPSHRLQGKGGLPFGCHLFLPGPRSDELARLVFSGTRSPLFPNSDELVAFWYDGRLWDYDDVDLASTPIVEPIQG
jgi:hypothetical protein